MPTLDVRPKEAALITLHLPAVESWTIDDLVDLPSHLRYELRTGRLVIMPLAVTWHQRVQLRICNALERAGRRAETQVGVLNTRGDARVVDVGVFHGEPDPEAAWHPASSLALVVHVWSPWSDEKERTWYARRGIAEYWLAEPIEGDRWGALITQYELIRTPSGTAAFVEKGKTTLTALEVATPS
jgi:Uma2 family endonuclease